MRNLTRSIAEAQKRNDYYMIMKSENDIIAVCPVTLIKSSQKLIDQLEYRMDYNLGNVDIHYIQRINDEEFRSLAIEFIPKNEIWINPYYSSIKDEILSVLTNDPKMLEIYRDEYPVYLRERIIPKIVEFGEGYFYMHNEVGLDDIKKFLLNFDVELTEDNIIEIQIKINEKLTKFR